MAKAWHEDSSFQVITRGLDSEVKAFLALNV
jgi:hypothetical protein